MTTISSAAEFVISTRSIAHKIYIYLQKNSAS